MTENEQERADEQREDDERDVAEEIENDPSTAGNSPEPELEQERGG